MGKWAGRNGTLEQRDIPTDQIYPTDETGHRFIIIDGVKQYLKKD
jgi:hypothetical protein